MGKSKHVTQRVTWKTESFLMGSSADANQHITVKLLQSPSITGLYAANPFFYDDKSIQWGFSTGNLYNLLLTYTHGLVLFDWI